MSPFVFCTILCLITIFLSDASEKHLNRGAQWQQPAKSHSQLIMTSLMVACLLNMQVPQQGSLPNRPQELPQKFHSAVFWVSSGPLDIGLLNTDTLQLFRGSCSRERLLSVCTYACLNNRSLCKIRLGRINCRITSVFQSNHMAKKHFFGAGLHRLCSTWWQMGVIPVPKTTKEKRPLTSCQNLLPILQVCDACCLSCQTSMLQSMG